MSNKILILWKEIKKIFNKINFRLKKLFKFLVDQMNKNYSNNKYLLVRIIILISKIDKLHI